jgi:1-acyl-sn-glycerol-3-phosphate acyltransferase
MKKSGPILYKLLRPVFTLIFHVIFHPTYINIGRIPKEGAVVLAGNHKHALDPIFVDTSTKRVVYTLAKKELHDGAFGWFFRGVGSIPVDLEAKKNHGALVAAIHHLNDGAAVNVSPEAARNYTKELLLPFKPGAVVMAMRSGCPIVPYSITGDYKFRSRNLTICFGRPISVEGLTVEEANAKLRHEVGKLLIRNKERNLKDGGKNQI